MFIKTPEEDAAREDTLYYVAMRVEDGKYISLEGSESADGYICKTGTKFENCHVYVQANQCHGLKLRLRRFRADIPSFSSSLFVGNGCTVDGPIPCEHHVCRETGEE